MKNHNNEIIAYYNNCASTWDDRYGRGYTAKYFLNKRLAILNKLCNLSGTETVLEIGCGTGYHLNLLSPQPKRSIGIDLSPNMINQAIQNNFHQNTIFVVDDAELCDSIPNNSMDIVFFVSVLEHLLLPQTCFINARRVLKPGGIFIGLSPNKLCPWYYVKPFLGLEKKHIDSDKYYSHTDTNMLLYNSGFHETKFFYWGFTPPIEIGYRLTDFMDKLENFLLRTPIKYFAGSLAFKAIKTCNPVQYLKYT